MYYKIYTLILLQVYGQLVKPGRIRNVTKTNLNYNVYIKIIIYPPKTIDLCPKNVPA
jgi:hypothetical protein